ncbi:MAG TPA: SRPBCC family protein, partial [Hyphomicrobiales bacterium]|nr:SRPBCC family protein [Hyphomicrobiales bacterium]
MKTLRLAPALLLMFGCTHTLAAEPEYVTIKLEIDIAKPAAEVWAKVGDYCDIGEWANLECVISAGDGGVGTVRSLAGGRVTEIMVAQTELSYGYTQPVVEGTPYNLYHGFMEARPV